MDIEYASECYKSLTCKEIYTIGVGSLALLDKHQTESNMSDARIDESPQSEASTNHRLQLKTQVSTRDFDTNAGSRS